MRRGRRFVIPEAVISVLSSNDALTRIGVITPKVVGNSVVRHRVARSIRHGAAAFLSSNPQGLDIVVRAQSGSELLSVSDWERVLASAIQKVSQS